MRYLYLLIILCCLSCDNQRVLQLPEIENADITEVLDVSPAYIFYDDTQPDSTLLNRKNLIISTNWLVNVDKRLSLRQAIPHIKFLQDKKRNAELHKNKDAKNYFSCNAVSIGNLGFLEFTDINFEIVNIENDSINLQILETSSEYFKSGILEHAYITLSLVINKNGKIKYEDESLSIPDYIDKIPPKEFPIVSQGFALELYFDKALTFQDYISFNSELLKLTNEEIILSFNQFIY